MERVRTIAAHGEMEPAVREPKPEWSAVPDDFKKEIERHFGTWVVKASTVWGGYTPSATYRLTMGDGADLFCKASHAKQTLEGRRAFETERGFFISIRELQKFAPRYHSSVSKNGWSAMFFDFIADRKPLPPWTNESLEDILRLVADIHAMETSALKIVTPARENEFSRALMHGRDGWALLAEQPNYRENFGRLFTEPRAAIDWLDRHLHRLIEIEKTATGSFWKESLIHLDLRSDNFLYSESRGPLLADWPFFSYGPVALDLAFLIPSIEGEGGPAPETIIEKYESLTHHQFNEEELRVASTLSAGFFAARAHQSPIPALPRVRWVQRLQFYPALNWMCRSLRIEPPATPPGPSFF